MDNKKWNTFWDIVPKTLFFKESFDITPTFGYGVICNENVKKAIEDNNLTGFVFNPLTKTEIESE